MTACPRAAAEPGLGSRFTVSSTTVQIRGSGFAGLLLPAVHPAETRCPSLRADPRFVAVGVRAAPRLHPRHARAWPWGTSHRVEMPGSRRESEESVRKTRDRLDDAAVRAKRGKGALGG